MDDFDLIEARAMCDDDADKLALIARIRTLEAKELRVGQMLYGFCGGEFGRDSYNDKRVEAIGTDWVIARDEHGNVVTFTGNPERLLAYTTPEADLA